MNHALRSAALAIAAVACCGCESRGPATSSASAASTQGQLAAEAASPAPAPGLAASAASRPGTSPAKTLPPSIAIPAKKPGADGVLETTFDDVKFEMVKTEPFREAMLTEKVKGLFDERIRIRGYMYPTLRKNGLKQFVLVRDNMECCFGPGAAIYDCILITMDEGSTAAYSIRPIAVEGEFRFDPLVGPDGNPLAIYQMKSAKVGE